MGTQDIPQAWLAAAREEARAVYENEIAVEDSRGDRWTLGRLLDMGLSRRQAILALGYIGLGFSGTQAIVSILSGNAQAAASGQVGTSANPLTDLFADSVDARLASIEQVGVKAHLNSSQTIGTGSITQVNLGATDLEDSDVFTVDLPNNNIDVDVAGTFYLYAKVVWAGSGNWSSGDIISTQLFVNGSRVERYDGIHVGENNDQTQTVTSVQSLSANDTIDMRVFHDRGGNESLQSGATRTSLQAHRIG